MNAPSTVSELKRQIEACTVCAQDLPLGPLPIVQFSANSRLLIIGQAPGTKVHASGVAWNDDSGHGLRGWLGLGPDVFYNPEQVAIMPMGFCYPGKAASGDAPPRKECAPLWHDQMLAQMPKERLTLLVGTYAQRYYLPQTRRSSLTSRVQAGEHMCETLGPVIALPHPSWRVRMWMARNPWFEDEIIPNLQKRVAAQIT